MIGFFFGNSYYSKSLIQKMRLIFLRKSTKITFVLQERKGYKVVENHFPFVKAIICKRHQIIFQSKNVTYSMPSFQEVPTQRKVWSIVSQAISGHQTPNHERDAKVKQWGGELLHLNKRFGLKPSC